MLNKVKEYALEKYAGDQSKADEFVNGFVKRAGLIDLVTTKTDYNEDGSERGSSRTVSQAQLPYHAPIKGMKDFLQEGFTGAIGKGLGGLTVGLGVHGMNLMASSAQQGLLHTRYLEALAKAISMNPALREEDRARVQQYADTVFKFAPHVAGDPNILSSILANAMLGNEGAGMDLTTIKTLGDLESRFIENRTSGAFSPKTYV